MGCFQVPFIISFGAVTPSQVTCKHAAQTCIHAYTCRHADMQTCRHADMQTRRHLQLRCQATHLPLLPTSLHHSWDSSEAPLTTQLTQFSAPSPSAPSTQHQPWATPSTIHQGSLSPPTSAPSPSPLYSATSPGGTLCLHHPWHWHSALSSFSHHRPLSWGSNGISHRPKLLTPTPSPQGGAKSQPQQLTQLGTFHSTVEEGHLSVTPSTSNSQHPDTWCSATPSQCSARPSKLHACSPAPPSRSR